LGLAYDGKQVVVATGSDEPWADSSPVIVVEQLGANGERCGQQHAFHTPSSTESLLSRSYMHTFLMRLLRHPYTHCPALPCCFGHYDAASLMARGTSFQRSSVTPQPVEYKSPFQGNAVHCFQTLHITPELIIDPQFNFRSTKILATLGPASWSSEKLAAVLDGGVSVVRLVDGLESLVWQGAGLEGIACNHQSTVRASF
jgi:hypothetical protein